MHPYIEIIFSLFLAFLGIFMMWKLNSLKKNRAGAKKEVMPQKSISNCFIIRSLLGL